MYGSIETNPLTEAQRQAQNSAKGWVQWDDPALVRITRLRLVSDPGFPVWDVSYCYGLMKDGSTVRVSLPFIQVPKGRVNAFIIECAKRDKVYAKGLGIFDAISTLI